MLSQRVKPHDFGIANIIVYYIVVYPEVFLFGTIVAYFRFQLWNSHARVSRWSVY